MSAYEQVAELIKEGKQLQYAAERNAATMAQLLVGNLRHVPRSTLRELKEELRRYNMTTGRWKR